MVVSAARWVRVVWVSEAVWHRGWSPVERGDVQCSRLWVSVRIWMLIPDLWCLPERKVRVVGPALSRAGGRVSWTRRALSFGTSFRFDMQLVRVSARIAVIAWMALLMVGWDMPQPSASSAWTRLRRRYFKVASNDPLIPYNRRNHQIILGNLAVLFRPSVRGVELVGGDACAMYACGGSFRWAFRVFYLKRAALAII